MTPNSSNLVFENLVVKPGLKFTLSRRCGGDITGFLTTSKDDEILSCSDSSGVKWGIGLVRLKSPKGVGFDELLVQTSQRP